MNLQWEAVPALRGVSLGFQRLAALRALWLDLVWHGANAPVNGTQKRFALRSPKGALWLDNSQSVWPHQARRSVAWPTGGLVHLTYNLPVTPGTPPRHYKLEMLFWDRVSQRSTGDWQVRPVVDHSVQAQVGTDVKRYGYGEDQNALRLGEGWPLAIYWPARAAPNHSNHVFVHLVSAVDGAFVSQVNSVPVDWLRPTNSWREREVLTDSYLLPVPENLAPAGYRLYVGRYHFTAWQRLPIVYQGQAQTKDRWQLFEVVAP